MNQLSDRLGRLLLLLLLGVLALPYADGGLVLDASNGIDSSACGGSNQTPCAGLEQVVRRAHQLNDASITILSGIYPISVLLNVTIDLDITGLGPSGSIILQMDSSTHRVFTVTASSFTLTNIVFSRSLQAASLSLDAGAISIISACQTDCRFSISRCAFYNAFTEKSAGAAIKVQLTTSNTFANISVSQCSFHNCSAVGHSGGAVSIVTSTGFTSSFIRATITESSFVNCSATSHGGAVRIRLNSTTDNSVLSITESVFSESVSLKGDGGAISINSENSLIASTFDFTNLIFVNSRADDGGDVMIRLGSVNRGLSFTLFNLTSTNAVASDVGAFFCINATDSIEDVGIAAKLINITNANAEVGFGGLAVVSYVTTRNVSLLTQDLNCDSTTAPCVGVDLLGIVKDATLIVVNSSFSNIWAGSLVSGAVALLTANSTNTQFRVSNCSFQNITAPSKGAGITFSSSSIVDSTNITVSSCRFQNTTSNAGSPISVGSTLSFIDAIIRLYDLIFSNISQTFCSGIWVFSPTVMNSSLELVHVRSNNTRGGELGVVLVWVRSFSSSSLTVSDVELVNAQSRVSCGIAYIATGLTDFSTIALRKLRFASVHASGDALISMNFGPVLQSDVTLDGLQASNCYVEKYIFIILSFYESVDGAHIKFSNVDARDSVAGQAGSPFIAFTSQHAPTQSSLEFSNVWYANLTNFVLFAQMTCPLASQYPRVTISNASRATNTPLTFIGSAVANWTFFALCPHGTLLDPLRTCQDVNSCQTDSCPQYHTCVDEPPPSLSFHCICDKRFVRDADNNCVAEVLLLDEMFGRDSDDCGVMFACMTLEVALQQAEKYKALKLDVMPGLYVLNSTIIITTLREMAGKPWLGSTVIQCTSAAASLTLLASRVVVSGLHFQGSDISLTNSLLTYNYTVQPSSNITSSSISIISCVFENISSHATGGALSLGLLTSGSNGEEGPTLIVHGCRFLNLVTDGSASAMHIYTSLESDPRIDNVQISVTETTFVNCSAQYRGGAVLFQSLSSSLHSANVTFDGVTFSGCRSNATYGAGVYVRLFSGFFQSNLIFNRIEGTRNSLSRAINDSAGAAVAVYLIGIHQSSLVVSNSLFEGNSAGYASSVALHNLNSVESNVSVVDTIFDNKLNLVMAELLVLYSNGSRLVSMLIEGCQCTNWGPSACILIETASTKHSLNFLVRNSIFSALDSVDAGPAVAFQTLALSNASFCISNCTFKHIHASTANSAAFYATTFNASWSHLAVTVEGSTFVNCSAKNGAVTVAPTHLSWSAVLMTNLTFINCTANKYTTGSIYLEAPNLDNSNWTIADVTTINSFAELSAGSICFNLAGRADNSTFSILRSQLYNSSSTGFGGGIVVHSFNMRNCTVLIDEVQCHSCTAQSTSFLAWNAINTIESSLTVRNCYITDGPELRFPRTTVIGLIFTNVVATTITVLQSNFAYFPVSYRGGIDVPLILLDLQNSTTIGCSTSITSVTLENINGHSGLLSFVNTNSSTVTTSWPLHLQGLIYNATAIPVLSTSTAYTPLLNVSCITPHIPENNGTCAASELCSPQRCPTNAFCGNYFSSSVLTACMCRPGYTLTYSTSNHQQQCVLDPLGLTVDPLNGNDTMVCGTNPPCATIEHAVFVARDWNITRISLKPGNYIRNGVLSITHSLEVVGLSADPNAINIFAQSSNPIFAVTSANFTLKNVTCLLDTHPFQAGGLQYTTGHMDVLLVVHFSWVNFLGNFNGSFINNPAVSILVSDIVSAFNISVLDCSFTNMSRGATFTPGGAIYITIQPNSPINHLHLQVLRSKFVDCVSSIRGGAVSFITRSSLSNSTVTLSNVLASRCLGYGARGGAFAFDMLDNGTNIQFSYEAIEVIDSFAQVDGGAISHFFEGSATNVNLSIVQSYFFGNRAGNDGHSLAVVFNGKVQRCMFSTSRVLFSGLTTTTASVSGSEIMVLSNSDSIGLRIDFQYTTFLSLVPAALNISSSGQLIQEPRFLLHNVTVSQCTGGVSLSFAGVTDFVLVVTNSVFDNIAAKDAFSLAVIGSMERANVSFANTTFKNVLGGEILYLNIDALMNSNISMSRLEFIDCTSLTGNSGFRYRSRLSSAFSTIAGSSLTFTRPVAILPVDSCISITTNLLSGSMLFIFDQLSFENVTVSRSFLELNASASFGTPTSLLLENPTWWSTQPLSTPPYRTSLALDSHLVCGAPLVFRNATGCTRDPGCFEDTCGIHADCVPTVSGSMTCTCQQGFSGDPAIYCRPLNPSVITVHAQYGMDIDGCGSATQPCASLAYGVQQAAIMALSVIELHPGEYLVLETITFNGSLTISGMGAPSDIVIRSMIDQPIFRSNHVDTFKFQAVTVVNSVTVGSLFKLTSQCDLACEFVFQFCTFVNIQLMSATSTGLIELSIGAGDSIPAILITDCWFDNISSASMLAGGAAITIRAQGIRFSALTIFRCFFRGITSYGRTSAVAIIGELISTDLTLDDLSFFNCNGTHGSAGVLLDLAQVVGSAVIVKKLSFTDCVTNFGATGGLEIRANLSKSASLNMTESIFTRCSARNNTGAFLMTGAVHDSKLNLLSNRFLDCNGNVSGAMALSLSTLSNSLVLLDQAQFSGCSGSHSNVLAFEIQYVDGAMITVAQPFVTSQSIDIGRRDSGIPAQSQFNTYSMAVKISAIGDGHIVVDFDSPVFREENASVALIGILVPSSAVDRTVIAQQSRSLVINKPNLIYADENAAPSVLVQQPFLWPLTYFCPTDRTCPNLDPCDGSNNPCSVNVSTCYLIGTIRVIAALCSCDLGPSQPDRDPFGALCATPTSTIRSTTTISTTTLTTTSLTSSSSLELGDSQPSDSTKTNSATTTVIIVLVIVVVLVVGVLGAVMLQRRRRIGSISTISSKSKSREPSIAHSGELADLEVQHENISIIREIGNGNFSNVMEASVVSLPRARTVGIPITVAAKFASPQAQQNDEQMLFNEAKQMRQFDHLNVVGLLGVCFQESPPCILMELLSNGDLRTYLRLWLELSASELTTSPAISPSHRSRLTRDFSAGFAYLASIKYVHRDLAARNIVLSSSGIAKIGDFGMSRAIRANDYYRSSSQSTWTLPLRWMAPESYFDGTWDTRSDVWSFAVTVWEIYTNAQTPWTGVADSSVMPTIQQRQKLPQPPGCPERIYAVMLTCWRIDPSARPNPNDLLQAFQDDYNKESALLQNEVLVWPSLQDMQAHKRRQNATTSGMSATDSLVKGASLRLPTTGSGDIDSPSARAAFDALELSRSSLTLLQVLGSGAFGEVRLAEINHPSHSSVTRVAVKCLKSDSEVEWRDKFLVEARTLAILEHKNIVRLLGVCTREDPLLMIIELMPLGELASLLRSKTNVFPVHELLGCACQIADAMQFLEKMRIVHRDLATRNVLVNTISPLSVKLSDVGLARTLQASDYYRKTSDDKVPIKWMAPESITERKYSSKSDVWSFGVACWELFSHADRPYPDMTPHNLMIAVTKGYRMPRPSLCPPDMYDIMLQCWQLDSSARPSFAGLYRTLSDLRDELTDQSDSVGRLVAAVTRLNHPDSNNAEFDESHL